MSRRFAILAIVLLGMPQSFLRADDQDAANAAPIAGNDGPLLDRILAADIDIVGDWQSFTLQHYDYCTLEIRKDRTTDGKFRLHFKQWTDAGSWSEKRTATYTDGVLTLNKAVDLLDGTRGPYRVLYTVRANGKEFLVSDVNARNLTDVDQLKRGFAYTPFHPKVRSKTRRKNPLRRSAK
jgi:hypothetical protein